MITIQNPYTLTQYRTTASELGVGTKLGLGPVTFRSRPIVAFQSSDLSRFDPSDSMRRSWRSWWRPSVAVMAYQARAPWEPVGKRCQPSDASATPSKTSTNSRWRSRREPSWPLRPRRARRRRCFAVARSACDASRSAARSLSTSNGRPTTAERTPTEAASARDTASVSEDRPPPAQTAATRSAADVDTPQRR